MLVLYKKNIGDKFWIFGRAFRLSCIHLNLVFWKCNIYSWISSGLKRPCVPSGAIRSFTDQICIHIWKMALLKNAETKIDMVPSRTGLTHSAELVTAPSWHWILPSHDRQKNIFTKACCPKHLFKLFRISVFFEI